MCLAIYISAVIKTLYIGWDAGFQYHLMAEMTMLLLYPNKNLKISIFFSSILLITFLALYFIAPNTRLGSSGFIVIVHTYNAVITLFALCTATLFFRANSVRLIQDLNISANTDPLTGLLNRRRMSAELQQHYNMARRYGQINSLILLDIDYFKKINDNYGHFGGDDILQQFSKLLGRSMRDTDIVSRWGGEEFLILTPATTLEDATTAAEIFRQQVEKHPFDVLGQHVNITITCGVVELLPTKQIENVLKLADRLLYKGKDNGRNRVEFADELNTQNSRLFSDLRDTEV